jgi:hypothetical protein
MELVGSVQPLQQAADRNQIAAVGWGVDHRPLTQVLTDEWRVPVSGIVQALAASSATCPEQLERLHLVSVAFMALP